MSVHQVFMVFFIIPKLLDEGIAVYHWNIYAVGWANQSMKNISIERICIIKLAAVSWISRL